MATEVIATLTIFSLLFVIYHHVGYPLLLRLLASKMKQRLVIPYSRGYAASAHDRRLPTVHLIIPAHNEGDYIAEKIRNVAALDYPQEKLRVSVVCDGCTDNTATVARGVHQEPECVHLQLEVLEHRLNRGKVAVINESVAASKADLVALSDVSALISTDALLVAAAHFNRRRIGVVAGSYQLWAPGSLGESAYWNYQTNIKLSESSLGSTLGVHGAFYVFRRRLFEPLAADTINDDFILPMSIVNKGFRAVYEPRICALELEQSDPRLDFARRVRIAAGNAQQALRLTPQLEAKQVANVFNFLSGKVLRVAMPYLMLGVLAGSVWLSVAGSAVFAALLALQLAGMVLSALPTLAPHRRWPSVVKGLNYLVVGHAANLQGSLGYALGYYRGRWTRASVRQGSTLFVHPVARAGKRAVDVVGAIAGLIITAPLFPLIALAIKLNSPGPILFRQLRIGRAMPHAVNLFTMMKFRTMYIDAEAKSGPQWASKNDPRITSVGLFLRKTRLDELPQLFNVIMGDMSLIGPRPERPGFYGKLETEIPFYVERTYGLLPGITGLAQVNQGYDESIDDVRRKLAFDHAYALSLTTPAGWLQTDLDIAWKTVAVMVLGRGQ